MGCGRARGVVARLAELVVEAIGRVDHEGVPVTGPIWSAFDTRILIEGVRPGSLLPLPVNVMLTSGCDAGTTVMGMP